MLVLFVFLSFSRFFYLFWQYGTLAGSEWKVQRAAQAAGLDNDSNHYGDYNDCFSGLVYQWQVGRVFCICDCYFQLDLPHVRKIFDESGGEFVLNHFVGNQIVALHPSHPNTTSFLHSRLIRRKAANRVASMWKSLCFDLSILQLSLL